MRFDTTPDASGAMEALPVHPAPAPFMRLKHSIPEHRDDMGILEIGMTSENV